MRFLLPSALVFFILSPLRAQTPPPPSDSPAPTVSSSPHPLLRRLDALLVLRESAHEKAIRDALDKVERAASSGITGVNAYEDAVRAIRFKGDADASAEFSEWQRKERDNNRSREAQEALRLHLRYMAFP